MGKINNQIKRLQSFVQPSRFATVVKFMKNCQLIYSLRTVFISPAGSKNCLEKQNMDSQTAPPKKQKQKNKTKKQTNKQKTTKKIYASTEHFWIY